MIPRSNPVRRVGPSLRPNAGTNFLSSNHISLFLIFCGVVWLFVTISTFYSNPQQNKAKLHPLPDLLLNANAPNTLHPTSPSVGPSSPKTYIEEVELEIDESLNPPRIQAQLAAAHKQQPATPTPPTHSETKKAEPVKTDSNKLLEKLRTKTTPTSASTKSSSRTFQAERMTPAGKDQCEHNKEPSTTWPQYQLQPDDDYTTEDAPLLQLAVQSFSSRGPEFQFDPTKHKQKGVIAYMCTSDPEDIQQLKDSLRAIDSSFTSIYDYPIAIFHEDYSEALMRELQSLIPKTFLYFVKIRFRLPIWLRDVEKQGVKMVKHRIPQPEHPTGYHEHEHGLRPWNKRAGRYPYGYQHMCRFFSGAGFMLPFFDQFDWYWRLDSDTVCNGRAKFDIFDHLASCGKEYAYLAPVFGDGGDVVENLWNKAVEWHKKEGFKPKFMYGHHKYKEWGENNIFAVIPSYNTNCEVASLPMLRSKQFQSFHRYLDRDGSYFLHRWGDAPVRFLEVSMYVDESKTEPLHGIECYHN